MRRKGLRNLKTQKRDDECEGLKTNRLKHCLSATQSLKCLLLCFRDAYQTIDGVLNERRSAKTTGVRQNAKLRQKTCRKGRDEAFGYSWW